MRAALYARVSSEEQVEGYSIDAQRRAFAAFCEARRWIPAKEYVEEGKSARTENISKRPVFKQTMADAIDGLYDVLIVHKVDRFSRKLRVTLEYVEKLARAQVGFDFLMTFVSGPWRLGPEPFSLEKHLERYSLQDMKNKPVVMVFQDTARYYIDDDEKAEYERIVAEIEARFIKDGYPMYPDIRRAALAVSRMISYYEKKG